MPKEGRLRKGTKSCIECRQRKVRCIFSGSDACDNCIARSRACVAQGPTSPVLDPAPSSRDRIHDLENEVASLWSVVRRLESNARNRNGETPGEGSCQEAGRAGPAAQTHVGGTEQRSEDATDALNPADSDSESLGLSPSNQPAHLRQLFDNGLLNSRASQGTSWDANDYTGPHSAIKAHLTAARRQLQRLIPPPADVATITGFSFPWMSIYFALFPRVRMAATAGEIMSQYDVLCTTDANPMSIANILISLALTVRQIPPEDVVPLVPGIKDVPRFIDEVTDAVDRLIVSNDVLAATLDGIETSLLFVRLALASVDIRKMWIRLRRIISLAELIGLPRASKPLTDGATQSQKSAAAVWESICIVDRLAGMMFNLPCATRTYAPQRSEIILPDGSVDVKSYLGRLTEIALSVQDLDSISTSERPGFEQLPKVFAVDEQLRSLADLVPAHWWNISAENMTPERLVQYWHHYFTVRTHLRLATADDDSGRYRLSYNTCVSASQSMAWRYMSLRPLLPAGFFACRVLDFQILTAAVFLLFDSSKLTLPHPKPLQQATASSTLVDQLMTALDVASSKAGGDFAEKAVVVLRSLKTLLQGPPDNASRGEMTLNIPLIGKIAVTRKLPQGPPRQVHATQTLTGWQQSGAGEGQGFVAQDVDEQALGENAPAPFWSMDVLDDFAFLPDVLPDAGDGLLDYGMPFGVA